ncbi:DegT/DnrJ/EryC1/StrS family aminotransferase [Hyunsoonleella pacifica]|uniref:DegT/DnrJ/EryC1/StrS family aminotransferase n=1 Tax=Hyunsoonleella pacifica TaxID=1080224 RepID=A0A4Q9FQI0_9FLAO|nr:DegT/DnrJ/EryC1/StrS family aminotransferase [Hyunsoonleella pacifica]TBN16732.1 DegT/DnrJ/EryC1/StrS family aminotransferase [Hyunsoonleella pacifica]GGD16916.1 aminotransferase DegT [Hyunsoonleella pacifica]
MNIDFANLTKSYLEHKKGIDDAIATVIESSAFIMGKKVNDLELGLEKYTGAKYAISCSSGTDALLLAMMAINIKPGDEIITTPFTFIATAETIAFLGATPVFVDINNRNYNINANLIEEKITERTKAIIPVSIFGQTADIDKINALGKKYNIPVIEDAAQSFGATYKGKKSCNLSTLGCTSFFPAKPLGCFGDGGAVFTSNEELADKIKSLRIHGQTRRYYHKYIGIGGRLDTIQASVLNEKLKYYENDIFRRQKAANLYTQKLKGFIETPIVQAGYTSVWAQYSIRIGNRDEVQSKLKEKGIPTAIHYPKPLHLQECFEYLGYNKNSFPVSELISNEIISLPMNPYITEEEIEYISENLKKAI